MRRQSMLFAAGILVAAFVAACGGVPTPTSNNGLLTEQNAIERAVEQLKNSAPGISGVDNPRNPVAWRMILGEYHQRTGSSGTRADTPVWVVQVEGESHGEGLGGNGNTYHYAIAVLDARSGTLIGRRASNDPLAGPTATSPLPTPKEG